LRVADDGPGVPVEERENIFTRFVRLDTSRSTPGHGLGLNLVAAVASAHRGFAHVVPTEVGLTIDIAIPLGISEAGAALELVTQ
jgi:signal transduction histidine kinase